MNTDMAMQDLNEVTKAIIGAAQKVVDGAVIVELKAMPFLELLHKAQCLNYLRATGLRLALLINFGRPKLEVRRIVSGY